MPLRGAWSPHRTPLVVLKSPEAPTLGRKHTAKASRKQSSLSGKESAQGCQGREDPLEKEMATHSSILAWESPWTEEPGRSMGSRLDMTEVT